jgi:PAT family beta-lactamase induction signal transducer AmpG
MSRRPPENWRETIAVYRQPRVVGMLFLGFSAGLPFPLVFTTLSTWLRNVGVDRTTIGFFAWIGITYSIKVFWSPVVDRAPLLLLTRWLGQRRGWMLLAQVGIAAGLLGMAQTDPTRDIMAMALFALLVAFASATQDIAIDAYRIEAVSGDLQGAMAGMYQSGYRVAAALVGGAGALYLAQYLSWTASYVVMAASMFIGIATVLIVREPDRAISANTVMDEQRVVDYLERAAHLPYVLRIPTAWFIGAVICPFTEFFQRVGLWAMLILLFIGIYRISDIVLANMAYPFYVDLGFTLSEIANIAKVFGVVMTIVGAIVGGVLVTRFGVMRILLFGAILVAATNLLFAQLAMTGKSLEGLAVVISADNFSGGLAGSAFIAYLSRLTNTAYTATQYALFSSLMTLMPKLISGFSGLIVDGYGYANFFIYASAMGLPAILLVLYLMWRGNLDETRGGVTMR